jgi:DNA-binding NtrC family response regulator
MKQRVPMRAWYSSGGSVHRPRVLVEDDDPALAISDFSLFRDAGFDVAVCCGPGHRPEACPLLRGQECDVLARADAVLHGLDPRLGVAAAIRQRHPDIAVVAEQHRRVDGTLEAVPDGCVALTYPCSVKGQLDAVRRALGEGSPRPGVTATVVC